MTGTPPRPGTAVRIRVPASAANLGPGFDSVGLALGLWDHYDIGLGGRGLQIEVTGESALEVPRGPEHLVVRAIAYAFGRLGVSVPEDLFLHAHNGIPHSRGVGSSAAAIVAGVAAAVALGSGRTVVPGEPLDLDQALVTDLATELEGHPDNASASVYGGMTVSWTLDASGAGRPEGATQTMSVDVHPDLAAVLLLPDAQLPTSAARAVLPDLVHHADAARGAGRAALLVEALSRQPPLLLPATRDWLHQEQRRSSFPPSMHLVDRLRARGHAAVISGAGPSVLVLTTRDRAADVQPIPEVAGTWRRLEPVIPSTGVRAVGLPVPANPRVGLEPGLDAPVLK